MNQGEEHSRGRRHPAKRSLLQREIAILAGGSGLALAAFYALHRHLMAAVEAEGSGIGALTTRQVLPLHAEFRPGITVWLLPALAAGALYFYMTRRWAPGDARVGLARLAGSVLLFLLMAVSVALSDREATVRGQQVSPVIAPYVRQGVEYYWDAPRIGQAGGVLPFLQKFAQPRLFTKLSLHAQTHPPGGLLFLWAASRLFGPSIWAAAVACILFTALAVPAVFGLARRMYGPALGYPALALLMVVPNVILYTVTSMDGPFMILPFASLYFFYRALEAESRRAVAANGFLTGGAFAAGTFMTYATVLYVFFWAGLLALLLVRDRARFRRGVIALSAAVLAFGAFFGALALAGYDVWGAIQMSVGRAEEMMGTGHETFGIYLRLSASNLAAFLFFVGVGLFTRWLRAAWDAIRGLLSGRDWDPNVLAGAFALLVAAFSTLFSAETERVWLSMVPLLLVPAARRQLEVSRAAGSWAPWRMLLGMQYVQLLLMEILLLVPW